MNPRIERKTRKCSYAACHNDALFYPMIQVWAKGYSKKKSIPLNIEVGMQFCKAHSDTFKLNDIPDLDKITAAVCEENKKLPPDFSTAELSMQPMIIG